MTELFLVIMKNVLHRGEVAGLLPAPLLGGNDFPRQLPSKKEGLSMLSAPATHKAGLFLPVVLVSCSCTSRLVKG